MNELQALKENLTKIAIINIILIPLNNYNLNDII